MYPKIAQSAHIFGNLASDSPDKALIFALHGPQIVQKSDVIRRQLEEIGVIPTMD